MDEFQNDGTGSCSVYGESVGKETLGFSAGFALDMVATFLQDALRKHTEMTDERNTFRKDGFNGRQALTPALDFHQICTGFAEFARVFNSTVRRAATACGQVGSYECLGGSSRYSAGVVDHVLHCNMRGIWMPKNDHSQGIADQQQIKPTLIKQTSSRIIVSRKRGKPSTCSLGDAE